MNFARKLLPIAIVLSASFAGVIFIVGANNLRPADQPATAARNEQPTTPATALATESAPNQAPTVRSHATAPAAQRATAEQPKKNYTLELAQRISDTIIKKNPDGPVRIGDISKIAAIKPEELIDKTLEESISSFDYRTLIPSIAERDIRIGTSNDLAAISAYAQQLGVILQQALRFRNVTSETLSINDLKAAETEARETANAIAALEAPPALAAFHRYELGLALARERIIAAVRDNQSDPVGALIAASAWPLVNEEFFAVDQTFKKVTQKPYAP